MVRCFLAIDVGPEVRRELAGAIREFRATAADVRWVREEGLHLTLAFLGSVDPARLEEIRRATAEPVSASTPIDLEVRGLGGFPTLLRPRILWAGVRADGLSELAAAIADALEPFGFARRAGELRAHITLGRVRSRRGWNELAPLVVAAETRNFGACKANAVHAYRSDLLRDGAVYTKLWTVEMGDDDGGIK